MISEIVTLYCIMHLRDKEFTVNKFGSEVEFLIFLVVILFWGAKPLDVALFLPILGIELAIYLSQ